jgi:hypothetical protein
MGSRSPSTCRCTCWPRLSAWGPRCDAQLRPFWQLGPFRATYVLKADSVPLILGAKTPAQSILGNTERPEWRRKRHELARVVLYFPFPHDTRLGLSCQLSL